MERSSSQVWIALAAAVAGLLVGYSLVILKSDSLVFANAAVCPLPQECANGECAGNCQSNCPGCSGDCQKKAS